MIARFKLIHCWRRIHGLVIGSWRRHWISLRAVLLYSDLQPRMVLSLEIEYLAEKQSFAQQAWFFYWTDVGNLLIKKEIFGEFKRKGGIYFGLVDWPGVLSMFNRIFFSFWLSRQCCWVVSSRWQPQIANILYCTFKRNAIELSTLSDQKWADPDCDIFQDASIWSASNCF